MISRRSFLQALSSISLAAHLPLGFAAIQADSTVVESIVGYLEKHRRTEDGYGWSSAHQSHITPTFAVVGCYHLLGVSVPNAEAVGNFVRTHYPLPPERRTVRALRGFDYRQVQTLLWLGQSVESFRPMLAAWDKPSTYENYYEKDGFPILQHQALALRARVLAGVEPETVELPWKEYFQERRRPNGTYNNTPAGDGSDGHLVNTHWAIWAMEAMHHPTTLDAKTIAWIRSCQMPSGGFTYAPNPAIVGLDNLYYTWAALNLLVGAKQPVPRREDCLHWILSLLTSKGGFQETAELSAKSDGDLLCARLPASPGASRRVSQPSCAHHRPLHHSFGYAYLQCAD
jgi:hypothetical protein